MTAPAIGMDRGNCPSCGQPTAVRVEEAVDGYPQYLCLNDRCTARWTKGLIGEPWDNLQRALWEGDPRTVIHMDTLPSGNPEAPGAKRRGLNNGNHGSSFVLWCQGDGEKSSPTIIRESHSHKIPNTGEAP